MAEYTSRAVLTRPSGFEGEFKRFWSSLVAKYGFWELPLEKIGNLLIENFFFFNYCASP